MRRQGANVKILYIDAGGLTRADQTYLYYGDLYRALCNRHQVRLY